MRITRKAWEAYRDKLAAISKKAADAMTAYAEKHGLSDSEKIVDYAYSLATKYGEAAAALSCQMYDQTAAAAAAGVPAAEPAATATYGETAAAIQKTMATSVLPESVGGSAGRLVKLAAEDTTLKNARRDGAEFAWIPSGDGCAFCMMIASAGWKRAKQSTASGAHASHIHPNCKCSFAIRFSSSDGVSGYHPDRLLQKYENAEGRSWRAKVNSLRREQYKENGDKIREQKRVVYQKHKDLEEK